MCPTTKACLCKSTVTGSASDTAGTSIYHFSFASNILAGYVSKKLQGCCRFGSSVVAGLVAELNQKSYSVVAGLVAELNQKSYSVVAGLGSLMMVEIPLHLVPHPMQIHSLPF